MISSGGVPGLWRKRRKTPTPFLDHQAQILADGIGIQDAETIIQSPVQILISPSEVSGAQAAQTVVDNVENIVAVVGIVAAAQDLDTRRLQNNIERLRKGLDVYVKDVKEARRILDNMPELRAGSGNLMPGLRDRRNTYRGDLINILDPTNSKIHDRGRHANQPHFNIDIRDENGVRHKPAIFIDE